MTFSHPRIMTLKRREKAKGLLFEYYPYSIALLANAYNIMYFPTIKDPEFKELHPSQSISYRIT